jgi:hypothetical protein
VERKRKIQQNLYNPSKTLNHKKKNPKPGPRPFTTLEANSVMGPSGDNNHFYRIGFRV